MMYGNWTLCPGYFLVAPNDVCCADDTYLLIVCKRKTELLL